MGATSRAGTAYASGAPEFTPGFSGVRVWWRLFQKRVVHTKFDIYVLLLDLKFYMYAL
jgi:hypothetical protein